MRAFADLALLDPQRTAPITDASSSLSAPVWLRAPDARDLVRRFAASPSECVAHAISAGFMHSEPAAIGACLHDLSHRGLDGNALGEYLSKESRMPVLEAFMQCIDFRGLSLVEALRRLFSGFKPAGEVRKYCQQ